MSNIVGGLPLSPSIPFLCCRKASLQQDLGVGTKGFALLEGDDGWTWSLVFGLRLGFSCWVSLIDGLGF